MSKGVLYAVITYFLWGLFPIYWKVLGDVPALQILSHRLIWSLIFVLLLLWWTRSRLLHILLEFPLHARVFILTAILISLNWFTYLYAVKVNRIVDASLGYFVNPMVNVVLGVLVLKEKLKPGHWMAVGLALCGVVYLALQQSGLPWIAIVLAITFSLYGLLRKTAPLNSLEGLAVETLVISPVALGYLLFAEWSGVGVFGHSGWTLTLLLLAAGPVTALPLLLFAAGARLIPYSQMAFIQYLSPTMQFLIGALLYHEPLPAVKLAGFAMVWAATALYVVVEIHALRQRRIA